MQRYRKLVLELGIVLIKYIINANFFVCKAEIVLAEDPLITTSSNSQDGKSHERSSWFYPSLTMDDGFYDSDFKELTSMQYLGNIANTK